MPSLRLGVIHAPSSELSPDAESEPKEVQRRLTDWQTDRMLAGTCE